MKTPIRITQIIVGLLFIVSGLVKANDPLGLSYKMQEFFEIWNTSLAGSGFFARGMLIQFFDFLHNHSLFLSITMITLEIGAGVALLLAWQKKFIIYLLLVLIVFFTFLTGYAFLSKNPDGSPKFTNCGCFGDCLPIMPQTSFLKDLALLVLIIGLIVGQKYIQPLVSRKTQSIVLGLSVLLSLLFQWYVLCYLPIADCLPFKKGNNIAAQMKPPPGSVPDSIAMRFIYEKEGKRYEFTPENLPTDTTYEFIDRIDKLVRKGNAQPKLSGFSLTDTSGQDHTQEALAQPRAVLIFMLDEPGINKWLDGMGRVVASAAERNIPVYMASSNQEKFTGLMAAHKVNANVYSCDYTVIRTAARTNPTVYLLDSGTIRFKFSNHKLGDAATEIKKF